MPLMGHYRPFQGDFYTKPPQNAPLFKKSLTDGADLHRITIIGNQPDPGELFVVLLKSG